MTTRSMRLVILSALALAACAEANAQEKYKEPAAKTAKPVVPESNIPNLPSNQPMPPAESEAQSDAGAPGSPTLVKLADETTPQPKLDDWEKAETFQAARITDKACVVKHIHEWIGVFCTHSNYKHIELISGEPREHLEVSPPSSPDVARAPSQHIVFPMHPGDRRIFEIDRWAKWSSQPDVLVTEQWLAGDAGPIVVVHGFI